MSDSGVRIFHVDEICPVERGNGVRSLPLSSREVGAAVLLTGQSLFPPGTAIPLHLHSSEEVVVLLQGEGVCEVEGQRHEVRPFDATFIPAGVHHRFINTGPAEMRIMWVYGGVDTTRTFVDTGETVGHLEPYRPKE